MQFVFILAYTVSVFVLSAVLPYCDSTNTATITNWFLRGVIDYILLYKFRVAIICGLYIAICTVVFKWVLPWRERNSVRVKILEQIAEVLGGNLHTHRITLYREISHSHAVIRACFMQLCNKFSSTPKENFLVLLPSKSGAQVSSSSFLPPMGQYLIIDKRCGLPFEKSFVMFQVEEDIRERCNSIIAYVRCLQETYVIHDLPDISQIPLEQYKSINEVPMKFRADVQRYLTLGRSNDFAVLQKYNRKARHFFGTIVRQADNNRPWGVLLIDSMGSKNPFPEQVQAQLESFAKILCVVAD